MAVAPASTHSALLAPPAQATLLPQPGHGCTLFLWRADGGLDGPDAEDRSLVVGGVVRTVRGERVEGTALAKLLAAIPPGATDSVRACAQLLRLAQGLVRRGSVRPSFLEVRGALHAVWRAQLDAAERALLVQLLDRAPPVLWAAPAGHPADAWTAARALLDALVDAQVRAAGAPPESAESIPAFETDVAHALAGDGRLGRWASAPRPRRALEAWEQQARARELPRCRLVLRLDPPADSNRLFPLSFLLEAREAASGLLGPVPAADVWADATSAHLLADDLAPVRKALREALHKAGQLFAPVEMSLSAEAPQGARLSAEEAWALLTRHKAALEAQGCRLVVHEALEGVEGRFPKARVLLTRTDGEDPAQVSLAPRYLGTWQVACGDLVLSPARLREAARQSPLASVDGVWLPMTKEAGERLAKVAEREAADWTGPQALAAALAGEVRLPGDLADAQVIPEPGMARLLEELTREQEPIGPPQALQATLRGYQARGVAWLAHRTRLGLGALLADDMGLGKTVQLIALLLVLRELGVSGGPTLLACPASLVGNWEREISRFAPSLKVVRHHGDARARDAQAILETAGPHDVVITTYGLIRRDQELLCQVPWGTVVCDEAQHIKNPGTAQAKSVRALPARRRVALSGTPVENRLTELWALLEFLNPGLLGPLDRFRRDIALPLERDRDARALRWLKAATSPFLLRRLKSDPQIAPELPEKEIIRVFCSLTEEQARLYKEAVEESLAIIDSASGMERRGRVLKLLTELKQICNHPAHFLGEQAPLSGRSGKLERASEMLEEIVDSGERALVFTQYTEMGERLCAHLARKLGTPVPFFHGGLSLPQRDQMVRDFQENPHGAPILVLSLKAGGVGLNLTRASHVLHYDRWWNPAVEDQATDRAHRIGQQKRVQVHHLITMGTLEERIDRMLEEKRGLADAVVSGGEAWLTELSTDELRALVSLGSDAAVESVESFSEG